MSPFRSSTPDGVVCVVETGRNGMHAPSSIGFPSPEAEMLGLDPGETDPVRIILAAQLRLRCCRRFQPAVEQRLRPSDVPRIVAARDALLRRAVGALIIRGLGCPVGGG